MDKDWQEFLKRNNNLTYISLRERINNMRAEGLSILPKDEQLFAAFQNTPFKTLKIIILGQDPYHSPNTATGLAFACQKSNKLPPSLRNIYKELKNEYPDYQIPDHGDLRPWAKQGVLLLNTVLSVEAHRPNSHKNLGWQTFTDKLLKDLSQEKTHLIFMLWGKQAEKKRPLIAENRHHLILSAAHPSPLARGAFFHCGHFLKANNFLKNNQQTPITWQL